MRHYTKSCGGYTVHPVPTPLSTNPLLSNKVKEGGKSQNLILFIRGKAISGAPSINGINQLPNPPIIIAFIVFFLVFKHILSSLISLEFIALAIFSILRLSPILLKSEMYSSFLFISIVVCEAALGLRLIILWAHVEAPVAGSIILAAILLKLGGISYHSKYTDVYKRQECTKALTGVGAAIAAGNQAEKGI
ncbi:hypothetical protein Avbf_05515 [Armadillidium vulgare]|nr:hypothetical protein Avbf_05515 [Armadillidium vulgare]